MLLAHDRNAEIIQLVFAREVARLAKNFAESDTLREQLWSLGVQLSDKTDSWTSSDGLSGKIPSWTDLESGATPETFLQQAPTMIQGATLAIPLDAIDPYAPVKQLVLQREQARAAKDFQTADRIREELKGFGVDVWDKEKIWKGQDGSCGIITGYLTSQMGDLEITALVERREKARWSKEFVLADVIRDELKVKGVEILDHDKMWQASDGRTGLVPVFNALWTGAEDFAGTAAMQGQPILGTLNPVVGTLKRPGVGTLKPVVGTLNPVVGTLKRPSNLQIHSGGIGGISAPPMKVTLRASTPPLSEAMAFNDIERPTSSQAASASDITAMAMEAITVCHQSQGRMLEHAEIALLVETRERLRYAKDMTNADYLRTAMSQCGLDVYDKEKTWKTSDGRQGDVPSWASFG